MGGDRERVPGKATPADITREVPVTAPTPGKLTRSTYPSGDAYVDEGTACDRRDGGIDATRCVMTDRQRDRLVLEIGLLTQGARTSFSEAIDELRIDELLKKDEELPWYVSLVLDVISTVVTKHAVKAVAAIVAQGQQRVARIANAAGLNADFDHWAHDANRMLMRTSPKDLEANIKLAVSRGKGAAEAGAKHHKNREATDAKTQRLAYLTELKNRGGAAFHAIFQQVATLDDGQLFALLDSLNPDKHSASIYKQEIAAKLERLERSGIDKIGLSPMAPKDVEERVTDDYGNRGEAKPGQDLALRRVARAVFVSGYPSRWVWADHFHSHRALGLGFESSEDADVIRAPSSPRTNVPSDPRSIPTTEKHQVYRGLVPDEFAEIALAKHRDVWAAEPEPLLVDDSTWYWDLDRMKAALQRKGQMTADMRAKMPGAMPRLDLAPKAKRP